MKWAAVGVLATVLLGAAAFTLLDSEPGECRRAEFLMDGESQEVLLEVADTDEERRKGLMGRTSLPEATGMLFVFEKERALNFWMKNTSIPLDVIYLDSEMKIVDIDRMNPQPGVPEEELTLYPSDSPAMYAVEMNQNFSRKVGLRKGDRLDLGSRTGCPF